MRASDVVTQLVALLPQLTDKFTKNLTVASMTRAGTVVTVLTEENHTLKAGNVATIEGAIVPITISSFSRVLTVGTIVTATDHDLTRDIAPTIVTSGATEAEFNGSFTMIQIVNRRTIKVTMANSGASAASGTPVLENAESALTQYSGAYRVQSVLDDHRFTITQSDTSLPDPIGTISARVLPRISAGVNPERIVEAYTKQNQTDYWIYVVLEGAAASKSRHIRSDAVENLQRGNFFRQQVISSFSLFVFIPVTQEVAAREARDIAGDLFRPICRSVLFSKFDSGLFVGAQNPVQFSSHAGFRYNTAVYVHEYEFQAVADLSFEDTVGPDLDVAFRDVDLQLIPDLGTQLDFMTADIDLDDVPL